MKVAVLCGSPHAHGTTAALAQAFCQGAEAAGHQVARFDTAKMNVKPCLGCMHCRKNEGKCVRGDDMEQLLPELEEAQAVVLVTPLYYFGMTAQLKTVIDRYFAHNAQLREDNKACYLLAACGDGEDWCMDGLRAHFTCLCRYMHWQEKERLLAIGYNSWQEIEESDFWAKAQALGAAL